MKEKLIIFPFNGNGLEAFDCIAGQYDFIGFADDTFEKQGKHEFFEVFPREFIQKNPEAKILAVVGSTANFKTRHQIIEGLGLCPERFATLIHPKASVSPLAKIGRNVLIMAGAVVTSNAVIGGNVCILPNTVVHHDVIIGDNTLVGSNVTFAGHVEVGANCYIGSGSSLISFVKIGDNSLIGMGTNVLRDLPENSKAVGNPARML